MAELLQGKLPAPLHLEADRSAYVAGESWQGIARGLEDVLFLAAGRPLIAAFSRDATVQAIGPPLLVIAGVCLIFDGTQGISTGILRGLGDTRTPMIANFAGHWLVGLPLGYAACFWWGWGVQGLWLGLAAGLTGVGLVPRAAWTRRVRRALPATAAPAGASR